MTSSTRTAAETAERGSDDRDPAARFAADGYAPLRGVLPRLMRIYLAHHFKQQVDNGVMRPNDGQVERAYAAYGLPAVETLLDILRPLMQQCTGLTLLPTYSYARVYVTGAELARHRDRPSCEISATLTVARRPEDRPWPLWFETRRGDAIPMDMAPGDLVAYRGPELAHWREPFEGEWQSQIFLHYVRTDGPHADHAFDKRPRLGLPIETRREA